MLPRKALAPLGGRCCLAREYAGWQGLGHVTAWRMADGGWTGSDSSGLRDVAVADGDSVCDAALAAWLWATLPPATVWRMM